MDDEGEAVPQPWSPFEADLNGDGVLTLADAGLWLRDAFFLPGDWVIWAAATHAPTLGRFMEIGVSAYGGLFSGFVSAFAWLALLLACVIVYHRIRRLDDAFTDKLRRAYAEVLRCVRVWRLEQSSRSGEGDREESVGPLELRVDEALTAQQARALRALLDLEPPGALGSAEIARMLEMRLEDARRVLESLATLRFLDRKSGAKDRDAVYAINSRGRAYLLFKQLAPKERTPPRRGPS